MDSVIINNGHILGGFGSAFTRLCQSKIADAGLKFTLLKLRRQLASIAEDALESLKDIKDVQQRAEFLEQEHNFLFKKIPEEKLLMLVSVEDCFLLSPIVKEGQDE